MEFRWGPTTDRTDGPERDRHLARALLVIFTITMPAGEPAAAATVGWGGSPHRWGDARDST
jgi:hypothetical protein